MQHHLDKRPGAGCKETEKHTLSANHLNGYLEVAEHVDTLEIDDDLIGILWRWSAIYAAALGNRG